MAKRKAARKRAPRPTPMTRSMPPELLEMIKDLFERFQLRCWNNFHIIEIVDNAALPFTLRVKEGDWVCWVNRDRVAHDVTFDAGFWPFENPSQTIALPGCSPSNWHRIRVGTRGRSHSYSPRNAKRPPGGPDIFVE